MTPRERASLHWALVAWRLLMWERGMVNTVRYDEARRRHKALYEDPR